MFKQLQHSIFRPTFFFSFLVHMTRFMFMFLVCRLTFHVDCNRLFFIHSVEAHVLSHTWRPDWARVNCKTSFVFIMSLICIFFWFITKVLRQNKKFVAVLFELLKILHIHIIRILYTTASRLKQHIKIVNLKNTSSNKLMALPNKVILILNARYLIIIS